MPGTRKYLTRNEYLEIAGCLRRALAVFARSTRALSSPELRIKNMLTALRAELEPVLADDAWDSGDARPDADGPARP
jgi:hypothetical protein